MSDPPCTFQHLWFPAIKGHNLNGKQIAFPEVFANDISVVILSFERWQRVESQTWLSALLRWEQQKGIGFIRCPVLPIMNPLKHKLIHYAMKQAVTETDRTRIVTLHTDRECFIQDIGVGSTSHIQVLLISTQGKILHRIVGSLSSEKEKALEQQITKHAAQGLL